MASNAVMGYTVDNSPPDTIYSFFILFWSVVVVSKWESWEKWLKLKHNSGFNDAWAFHQKKTFKDDGTLP